VTLSGGEAQTTSPSDTLFGGVLDHPPASGLTTLPLTLGLALLLLARPAAPASFPPGLRFRTLETERVLVHYPRELEDAARQTASMADEILARHVERYGSRIGKVQIVLTDTTDSPNGFTTAFPYPLVHIRAVAPKGDDEFGNHDGWLRLVLTHELAHAVHLEESRGIVRAGRRVFGRAPYLFPNSFTPGWMLEGLATYEETQGTAFGRGRNPDVRMVLRSAALAGEFLGEDRATLGLDRWPSGLSAYFFGEAFVDDLSRRFGAGTLPALAREHSGHILPYLDEVTAYKVTGATFHVRWLEWALAARQELAAEAGRIESRGVTRTTPLTERGVTQTGPRFSPDGAWIAYSSSSLTRFPCIRLMRPDGSEDHELARRNSGSSLSWTPDGRGIVFDEIEIFRLFATYSDLRVVDVASGAVTPLTHGLRARDPDVGPDGRIVFVRQTSEGSELALMGPDGSGLTTLVEPRAGFEWSGPCWRSDGGAIAASRLAPGGWLDIVVVDPKSGAVEEVTHDRAKDVEPSWTRDGRFLLFRSDRDGVSNVYAFRFEDRALLRVTNLLGGAFAPDVGQSGEKLVFAGYGSRGYDIQSMPFDPQAAQLAEPFIDRYPAPAPDPPPAMGADAAYNPVHWLAPRFWTPYVSGLLSGETQLGVATGAIDPLFRHAYGVEVHRGSETGRLGFRGYYQYDRLRPTLTLALESLADPQPDDARLLTRDVTVTASLPLTRTLRATQAMSVAWRRQREVLEGGPRPANRDLGAAEVAWSLSTARQYPETVSPVEGWQVRVAGLKELPELGSDVSLWKGTADVRGYARVGQAGALAFRTGGGVTLGAPSFQRSFAVGGFPEGSLFDLVGVNPAILRGFPDGAFQGRHVFHASVELRVPLADPQRGYRSLPVFLRHVHAAAFADAAQAWSGAFQLRRTRTDAGLSLGGDLFLGHQLPVTWTVGLARGFGAGGEIRAYSRLGLAF
jgi:Tol biopolymer transport system component